MGELPFVGILQAFGDPLIHGLMDTGTVRRTLDELDLSLWVDQFPIARILIYEQKQCLEYERSKPFEKVGKPLHRTGVRTRVLVLDTFYRRLPHPEATRSLGGVDDDPRHTYTACVRAHLKGDTLRRGHPLTPLAVVLLS